MSTQALEIRSVGLACNIGLTARAACCAMRAHISRFEEVAFDDSHGAPIVAAPAVEAVQGRQGYERLIPLLIQAVTDCIVEGGASPAEVLRSVPCIIVVDHPDRTDLPRRLGELLVSSLSDAFGTALHPLSRVVALGVTGTMEVLRHLQVALSAQMDSCLVIAVDSLINGIMLAALDSACRLKTPANSDGIIPGEAAAALWISLPSRQYRPLARVLGVCVADEPSALDGALANCGIGLAAAMDGALAQACLPLSAVDLRVGALSGERLGFIEASTALARIQKVHKDDFELWAPADQLGDNGAALGACILVAATMGLAGGYSPGPTAIAYCMSAREKRAACVMAAANI